MDCRNIFCFWQIDALLDLTANSYSAEAALACELSMLQVLDFDVMDPTPVFFARFLVYVCLVGVVTGGAYLVLFSSKKLQILKNYVKKRR